MSNEFKASAFLGYTVGLAARLGNSRPRLVKVEIRETIDGRIQLIPVSGWNLAQCGGTCTMSRAQYDSMPADNIEKAIECLALVGWKV